MRYNLLINLFLQIPHSKQITITFYNTLGVRCQIHGLIQKKNENIQAISKIMTRERENMS